MQERVITVVNQVGYGVDAEKIAIHARQSEASALPIWEVRGVDGEQSFARGTADAGFWDAASGDFVYPVDFSSFNTPGRYILRVDGVDSYPFQIEANLYSSLKHDALLYFYRNRSGIELKPEYAGAQWARPAGHLSDKSVTGLKGIAGGKPTDGCDYRLDAGGGWYDAGDYGKYVVNGGIALWTLMNFYEHSPQSFPDGSLTIPENGNGWPDILDEIRWEMDFLLRMQVPEGQPLAGMAHHKLHDCRWSGIPVMPPTEMNNDDSNSGRFLMPPSTAATLNLAATAAQSARIWKAFDSAFAARCLKAAEKAWGAAQAHPDMLYNTSPGDDGGGNYGDNNVEDEFYWAATELYITTGENQYRDWLVASPYFKDFSKGLPFTWDNTAPLGSISLALVSNGLPREEIVRLRAQIVSAADGYLVVSRAEGYRAPIKASEYVWGSNSFVLNNAIILALAHDFTRDKKYLNGTLAAMNYLLGVNPVNQSFVSGYGTVAMRHPHHRFWGNQMAQGFPPPPPGAVSGGANGNPVDEAALPVANLPTSRRYIDVIGSFSTNEVAINWNAPLVWIVAYLDEQFNH